jgi:hypothetical protein
LAIRKNPEDSMRLRQSLASIAMGMGAILLATAMVRSAEPPLDPDRIKALVQMLSQSPAGVGRPITDRAAWEQLAKNPAFGADSVDAVAQLLGQPIPEQPDDLFLEYSKNGNRTHWQKVASERRRRLVHLVLAECLENKGRFLPAVEQYIAALCAEKTWVMPAHDGKLTNFNGTAITIDLGSSALAWNMATADYLLGDKLSPAARQAIRRQVRKFVLDPYKAMIAGTQPPYWMASTNNWNAVCHAGVIGAALEQIESPQERALFVAGAEKYIQNFLAGFTDDGYCSEGLGYWNYGFGHYVLLAETLRQATGGKLDWMTWPQVKAPARFGANIQIMNGISPAFADCHVDAKPSPAVMYYVNRRFGMGLTQYDELDLSLVQGSLFEAMLYSFPNSASATAPAKEAAKGPGLRTFFEQAGILIGRPAAGSECRMGVALKGGNNAEHHNHNDVGSYVVVVGDRAVLLDPGAETYTARTFSSRRYESKLLNSFGHPVPVVAGQLQKEGRESQALILGTDFSDQADTLRMDIASAYRVPDLKTLERMFIYSRKGTGSLTVMDRVEFEKPETFGTALITLGKFRQVGDNLLLVMEGGEAVLVDINTGGEEFALKAEPIEEDAPVKPIRIGINLVKPVKSATITLRMTPSVKAK